MRVWVCVHTYNGYNQQRRWHQWCGCCQVRVQAPAHATAAKRDPVCMPVWVCVCASVHVLVQLCDQQRRWRQWCACCQGKHKNRPGTHVCMRVWVCVSVCICECTCIRTIVWSAEKMTSVVCVLPGAGASTSTRHSSEEGPHANGVFSSSSTSRRQSSWAFCYKSTILIGVQKHHFNRGTKALAPFLYLYHEKVPASPLILLKVVCRVLLKIKIIIMSIVFSEKNMK